MALSFEVRREEPTVPVVVDGREYRARAGSARALAAVSDLARAMEGLGAYASGDLGEGGVEAALGAVGALDAPLRAAVDALFGPGAAEAIVGPDEAGVGTAVAAARMMTAVLGSDEYLAASARCVAGRAETLDGD